MDSRSTTPGARWSIPSKPRTAAPRPRPISARDSRNASIIQSTSSFEITSGGTTLMTPLPFARRLGEQAMFGQQTHHQSLRHQGRRSPRKPGQIDGERRRIDLDADHQSPAAHLTDAGDFFGHSPKSADQGLATLRRAFDEAFLAKDVQDRQTIGHRQRILAERRTVNHGAFHRVEHLIEDRGPAEDRPDRNRSRREPLGETDDVGFDTVHDAGERRPRPAQAGLHLVGDQERSGVATDLRHLLEHTGRVRDHALALNRFEEERRHGLVTQCATKMVEISEGNLPASRDQGLESTSQPVRTVDRQCAERQSVKSIRPIRESGTSGGGPGDLHRGFHRLRAAVDEEDPIIRAADESLQRVRQGDRERRRLELNQRRGRDPQCLFERFSNHGMVASE